MASSDARAALMHDLRGRRVAEHGGEFLFQYGSRFEAAVAAEIVLKKAIGRARDMAANRIERFVLAAKAIGAARIDQACAWIADFGSDECGIDRDIARAAAEIAWGDGGSISRHG